MPSHAYYIEEVKIPYFSRLLHLYCMSCLHFQEFRIMFSSYCFLFAIVLNLCVIRPSIGAKVDFEVDLTWEIRAPDGQQRYVILTNGHFPGPPLLLNQGDDVKVCWNRPLNHFGR